MRTRHLYCALVLSLGLSTPVPVWGTEPAPVPPEPTALKQLREHQERQQKLQQQRAQEPSTTPTAEQPAERPTSGHFTVEHSAPLPVTPPPAPQPGQAVVAPPADTGSIANQMQQRLNYTRQQQQQQQGNSAGGNEDAEVNELEAAQKKMMDQYGALNAVNPMSADSSSGGTGVFAARRNQAGPQDDQLTAFQARASEWMSKPWFREFSEGMQKKTADPQFVKAVSELTKNKSMRWMYAGIVIWTLVCWFLKRRVLAATDRLLPRLMLRAGMYCVYLGGYFLVSYTILGPPLVTVLEVVVPAFFTAGKAALAAALTGAHK